MRRKMHRGFRDKMVEAEHIREAGRLRRDGDGLPHLRHIARTVEYGRAAGLVQGVGLTPGLLEGAGSEEDIAQATEMAACILEVTHGEERIGSVLDLSKERKLDLMHRAKERVEQARRERGDVI